MAIEPDKLLLDFWRAVTHVKHRLPLYGERVPAGFPSPADGYQEKTLDLNELCIEQPSATYFVRIGGESLIDKGIMPNDIAVVNRSIDPYHGCLVIAMLNGEFTAKELQFKPTLRLVPHNENYPAIEINEDDDFEVFGVIRFTISEHK